MYRMHRTLVFNYPYIMRLNGYCYIIFFGRSYIWSEEKQNKNEQATPILLWEEDILANSESRKHFKVRGSRRRRKQKRKVTIIDRQRKQMGKGTTNDRANSDLFLVPHFSFLLYLNWNCVLMLKTCVCIFN